MALEVISVTAMTMGRRVLYQGNESDVNQMSFIIEVLPAKISSDSDLNETDCGLDSVEIM